MKLCPYCGKIIVPKALACKHCGEWLEDISGYLREKGSVYAHTDSISLSQSGFPSNGIGKNKHKSAQCVFCEHHVVLSEKETNDKKFICANCKKKNIFTNGNSDEVLRNIPVGWGWVLLTVYFAFAVNKYLETIDDVTQIMVTFSLSICVLLVVYFFFRRFILKKKYERKKSFGKIYTSSVASGFISTIVSVLFIFVFHLVYPYTGLQSDRIETSMKVKYFESKISKLSERQEEINGIISEPISGKSDGLRNSNLIDEYINLNNEEKKYLDSIYSVLEKSDYYSGDKENIRKLKEANLLINKIIAYKIMSARNLKYYYSYGNKNSLKAVKEINTEISKLSDEYSKKYKDIINVD